MNKDLAAAIDLGTHTARLLIAQRSDLSPWRWTPVARRRAYIRLAADSCLQGGRELGGDATAKILPVLRDFSRRMEEHKVDQVYAVATGIFRDAVHADRFLAYLYQETGIPIRLISGEQEALLSGRGACAVLNIQEDALVFDLGGGTTEFLRKMHGETTGVSVSLGSAVLTKRWVRSDPPGAADLAAIAGEVEHRLEPVASDILGAPLVIGTGGTVTTLAAMVHGITTDDICPEKVNGRMMTLHQAEACLAEMKTLTIAQRKARLGLDPGRADVIVAGALVVMGIMRFLGVSSLSVSMSDLLEGLLIAH